MVTVTINLWIVAYLVIGACFAWRMAISPQAVVILVLLWPVFAVLVVLAPAINYFVNKRWPPTQ